MCFGWFNFWISYGYDYDITLFTDWDFNEVGWTWPSGFDFEGSIVTIPQFDWLTYLVGWQLEFYNWLLQYPKKYSIIWVSCIAYAAYAIT